MQFTQSRSDDEIGLTPYEDDNEANGKNSQLMRRVVHRISRVGS